MAASAAGLQSAAFAGRTPELSILKAAADAADAGRFSAVLISGEPGIGKTRLGEQTCDYARKLGFAVVVGHCFETQSRVSYFPFIQALRQLKASSNQKLLRGAANRARSGGRSHVSEQASSTPRTSSIVPRLTGPGSGEKRKTGAQAPPDAGQILAKLGCRNPRAARHKAQVSIAGQTDLFDSVVCSLRSLSYRRPTLVVLEDLDCADDGSLSLLVHIVRTLAAARLLIIATCCGNGAPRSELRRTIAELARCRDYQRIRLRGLAEPEAAGLVEGLLGLQLAAETKRLAASVGRISNGNPLFIHQIVRQMLETGRLSNHSGQWVTSSGWESKLAAEDGLLELVDSRLAQLSERCRDALGHAAVLGDEFEVEVLARTLQVSAPDLIELFDEARAGGILVEAKSDETADYSFAHALIRQSLYERLSRPSKRALHAVAAHALEDAYPGDLDARLPQLALHYARAGTAGDLAKAVDYSMRAGELAYAVCAYADAACHWRSALRLAGNGKKRFRAQLLERLGEASLLSSATPGEAARRFEGALKLYGENGEEQDAARVHARLVMVQSMPSATFDVGQAVSHSRRAEKLLALRSDRNAEGELLIGEAIVAHAQLRTQDGMAVSERAMEIGQALDNSEIWCLAAALHGHFLWASGKLAAGLALMEQAFLRAAQARDLKPRLAAAWLRGFSYLLLWDPGAADRAIQLGLAGSDSTQAEFLRQILVTHAGIAHAFTGALADARSVQALAPHQFLEANIRFSEGEWTQAEALLIQQIERSDAAQSNQQHWTASLWLARLKRIEGEYDRALELLTNTPLIAQQLVRIPEEIATRSELALIHLGREQVAEARSEVLRCRTLLTEHEDWRALGAFVDRAEAAMLAQSGLLEEARGRFMKAGQVFSQYRVPGEVAETLVSWGAQFLRAGKAEEGVEKLDGAIQIYRHLGLGPRWQARVERLRRPVLSISAPPQRGLVQAMPDSTEAIIQPAGVASSTGIYALATTNDVALLATLIHDAIAHLMNAIDRASKLRAPIDRIAEATEKLSKITAPVDRLAHALEQAAHNTASGTSHTTGQPTRTGRSRGHKLNRSHDPGRPL